MAIVFGSEQARKVVEADRKLARPVSMQTRKEEELEWECNSLRAQVRTLENRIKDLSAKLKEARGE